MRTKEEYWKSISNRDGLTPLAELPDQVNIEAWSIKWMNVVPKDEQWRRVHFGFPSYTGLLLRFARLGNHD